MKSIRQKTSVIILLLALLICSAAAPVLATAYNPTHPTVPQYDIQKELNVPLNKSLSIKKDELGNYSGYSYDYLLKIAQITGNKFNIIENPDKSDLDNYNPYIPDSKVFGLMNEGKLDFIPQMVTGQEKNYLYTEREMGFQYTVLTSLQYNNEYDKIIGGKQKLRVAAAKGATMIQGRLKNYCDINNIDYELIEVDKVDENGQLVDFAKAQYKLLEENKADVMLTVDLSILPGTTVRAKFAGQPYFFAFRKTLTEESKAFSDAINLIDRIEPEFRNNLYNKYYGNHSYALHLTQEEKGFIANNTFKVYTGHDYKPFSFNDKKPTGISVSVLKNISEMTGLKLDFTEKSDYESCDIYMNIPSSSEYALDSNLILSTPFYESAYYLFTRRNIDINKKKDLTLTILESVKPLPSLEFKDDPIKFSTLSECLDAVNRGKADFGYSSLINLNYFTSRKIYNNLIIANSLPDKLSLTFGVQKTTNPILLTIINKALAASPDNMVDTIFNRDYFNVSKRWSITDLIALYPIPSALIISSFFLVLIACIGIMFAHRALAYSRFQTLANNIDGGIAEIFLTKDILKFKYINDGMSKLTGLSKEQFQDNQNIQKLFATPEEYEKFINALRTCVTHKKTHNDFKITTADEKEIWVTLEGNLLKKEASGAVIQFTCFDNTKLKLFADKVVESSKLDPMTNLLNKAETENLIQYELQNSTLPCCLIMLDINKFKQVNDVYGHFMGDTVIKEFANSILQVFRSNDICGRVGGDEFIVFLKNFTSQEKLLIRLQSFYDIVSQIKINNLYESITCSIGAAIILDPINQSYFNCFTTADNAMYEAKLTDGHIIVKTIEKD